MKRSVVVGLAAAGIAALVNAPAKAQEIHQTVKMVIVTCMLQSDAPRPFKAADASGWNDYRFDGDEVVFFNEAAMVYYRAKCKASALAAISQISNVSALVQDQSGLSQLELVRCMVKHVPDLVEGHDGDKRDYNRRPCVVEYTTSRAADAGQKCTTELRKK